MNAIAYGMYKTSLNDSGYAMIINCMIIVVGILSVHLNFMDVTMLYIASKDKHKDTSQGYQKELLIEWTIKQYFSLHHFNNHN